MVRAQWRDLVVLFHESGGALLLFVLLVFGSATLFYFFYTDPETGTRLSFARALYGAFSLLFFQDTLAFPGQWYLEILYFIVPILGLVTVVDGVIRFGVALTNKQERGQKWQIAMASTYSNHIIICGVGKVGYHVTLELLKLEQEVVAIDSNLDGRFVEKVKALGIPVIIADARRSENLVKAGVERATAIIPCTDDELANLDIALDARELNPTIKVVMRMFDPDLARRIEKGFGIHTAYSVSALAAPVFAAASMRVNVKSSFYAGNELLNISELEVQPNGQLPGLTIGELEEKVDCSVMSITHGETFSLHPASVEKLVAGCRLLVVARLDNLERLQKLNRPNLPGQRSLSSSEEQEAVPSCL